MLPSYPHLPSPQQLRYLITLFEVRHFGRAARACAVTQSTLSSGILALENQLNAPLLDRHVGKKVIFTPLGEQIVEEARKSLETLQTIPHLAAQYNGTTLEGPLRLGLIPTIGPYLIGHITKMFQKKFPKITVSICENTTDRLLKKLFLGTLDILVLATPCACEGTYTYPLWRDPFCVIMPKNHPLSSFKEVPAAAIGDHPMIMMEDGHCIKEQTVALCLQNAKIHTMKSFEQSHFTVSTFASMVTLVAQGYGIGILPQLAMEHTQLSAMGVISRPLQGELTYRTLTLACRPKAPQNIHFETFAEALTLLRRTSM